MRVFAICIARHPPSTSRAGVLPTRQGTELTFCDLPGATRPPRLQLQTVIGSGKFSTVWKALHLPR